DALPIYPGPPGSALGEGPRPGSPHPPTRDRRGQSRCARADPRPLDLAARPRNAQGAGSPGERRGPGGARPAWGPGPPPAFPEAKRLRGSLANSRGHRHEENAAKLVNAAREQPLEVGAALLASAEGYTPRANQLIDAARDQLGTLPEVAHGPPANLPAPKQPSGRSRRRRRRRKKKSQNAQQQQQQAQNGQQQPQAAQDATKQADEPAKPEPAPAQEP